MIKNLTLYKMVIATFGLGCALGFVISHIAKGATASANHVVNKQVKEVEGYKNWVKVNAVPQLMPAKVSIACNVALSPDSSSSVDVDGDENPHRDKYFTVYVNDVGSKAMLAQKSPNFPEGSVIVKEKLSTEDSKTPELLTVMIKRKRGFNPASGDWEYMVLDGTATKVEGRGNLQNCQACHLEHQKNDYVFRTYLSYEVKSDLK